MIEGDPGIERQPASRKLAAAIAARIVVDISDAGWPEGEVFGSEAELLDRYGVSRAVLREAVRLLEHQEVARMRRGPGGGLVVTVPSVESVIQAVMVYLLYVGAGMDDVFEARQALEQEAASLAAVRLGEGSVAELRDLVDREATGEVGHHHALHVLVAAASGNPVLEFFVDLLHRVTLLYAPESGALTAQVLASSVEAHTRIVDSIVGGDASGAARRMRSHLDAEAEFIRTRMPDRLRAEAVFSRSDGGRTKMAESVARQLFVEVVDSGWPVGHLLGSEADLMVRFDVSRAVLREAVRVLEHHQVARMRRGPGGGLQVTAPGIDATTVAMALHLDRVKVESDHLYEVRRSLEMAVLDRVIADADADAIEALEEVLAHPPETQMELTRLGQDLHTVLATLSGNRVLELLTDVTVRLSRGYTRRAPVTGPIPPLEELHSAHRDIVDAIARRDASLARFRMRRHLETLPRWMS
ncbi:MAG: FadR/GntR family transcriptional regulator [Acidimicrobiales bacterium]